MCIIHKPSQHLQGTKAIFAIINNAFYKNQVDFCNVQKIESIFEN